MSVYYYGLDVKLASELTHHGIKGQKWGVRRTPEQLGRRGYSKRVVKNLESIESRVGKQKYLRSQARKEQHASNLRRTAISVASIAGLVGTATMGAPLASVMVPTAAAAAASNYIAKRNQRTLNDISDAYGLDVARSDLKVRVTN